MPVRKSTRNEKKSESSQSEEPSSKDESLLDSASMPKTEPEDSSASPSGEFFFSTDGGESEYERANPHEEESSGSVDEESNDASSNEPMEKQASTFRSGHSSHQDAKNFNQSNHPNGPAGKKLTWQEKKKLRKRQKFKKPRRLPYEETETKHLEIGQLLETESLASSEALSALREPFDATEASPVNLNEYLSLSLLELTERVGSIDDAIELPAAPLRDELIDALLDHCLSVSTPVELAGVIEVMEDGHGFLLQQIDDYRLKSQSAFVPETLVRGLGLKTGHLVKGRIRAKMEGSSCPVLLQVDEVMGKKPEDAVRVTPFTELTPYYPLKRMYLETHHEVEWDNVAMRVVDLVSPVGFGQRGLIVAPPRTGKTVLQQAVARALRQNNPDAHLIVLLVDERPEEVTDFRRQVPDAEVIASTFDESAESHVHAAEIVIEKARRMVEHEQHVVILLDSITRLARAYNTTMPNSGKILSGGVEATALQRPKRFFGSARNIEGGGSLTILGTALVETGSKMDEVIFEEFKGTGNMELHLDRELSNKRIFPALDFEKSGTRKEELLYHPDELNKIYSLRRSMKGVPPADAMEMFIQRVRKTKNNPEFLMGLGK